MIGALLKKLFPRIFLKRAFLTYNELKARTWDNIFFRKEIISDDMFLIKEERNPFSESQIDTSKFPKHIADKFSLWIDPHWKQDQYLLHYTKEGFIEPKVGWGVTLNRKLLYPSLGFAAAPHVHKPNFVETYFKKPRITVLQKVISLRDTGEENYFHFFNDVISKLFFLEGNGVELKNYTIVISNRLYGKHYFQSFLQTSFLKNLNWHVQQSEEWIRFDEAFFCKPYTHTKAYFDRAVDSVVSFNSSLAERRVFLTRSKESLRYIENFNEIEPLFEKYNFQVMDASQISFEAQIDLFQKCRYLVAIHGAGITNIIFRKGNPLSLLEIVHPSPYIPFHYAMMCKIYNFQYSVMVGDGGKQMSHGGFIVNPKELELELLKLMSA